MDLVMPEFDEIQSADATPLTEPDRSSGDGRFPPSKTAVGTFDADSPEYSFREELWCRVLGERIGGYEVAILKDGNRAFLKTKLRRTIGDEILANFVYYQDKIK